MVGGSDRDDDSTGTADWKLEVLLVYSNARRLLSCIVAVAA